MKRLLLIGALVLVAAGAVVSSTSAHLQLSSGVWSWRYYSHVHPATDCYDGHIGRIDPTSIIFYQYGEYSRIDRYHVEPETDWGYFPDFEHDPQDICGTTDGSNYSPLIEFQEQQGHGCLDHCLERAHIREWWAPHAHGALVDKWSVATPHHERVVVCGYLCYTHEIDENWETWEYHFASQMGSHHLIYIDYYYRTVSGYWRGWYDSGSITRVGGLHDGVY